ncbi:unnamed protein product [Medioppia subpectinata]|uniref:Protein kinase domain-containing protein n=1 Tax=Medioppia subpectinata TaxID=1979941 RepID=A0A7R9Q204_9ACAR|nr:unnamed protein product [Medioppia subpectinata]CAG2108946.1 unnamed protein product [Medioppia subpectinata]
MFVYKAQFIEQDTLGSGCFGIVFKVKHKLTNKIFAVKRVQFKDDFSDEKKQRVLNEVKSLEKLDSIFVVKYYNSWTEGTHLYIHMEYCTQTLKHVLQVKQQVFERQPKEPLNIFEYYICCQIFRQLLQCLQFLHESCPPVIHRDLKPSNILISYNNNNLVHLKLGDFGMATEHKTTFMSHTQGAGNGKYMAPEVSSSRDYDHRADIYSIGLIGAELFDADIRAYNSKIFSSQYNVVVNIFWSMMNAMSDNRPSCSKVLKDYSQWTSII